MKVHLQLFPFRLLKSRCPATIFGQTQPTQFKPEYLSKQQLNGRLSRSETEVTQGCKLSPDCSSSGSAENAAADPQGSFLPRSPAYVTLA